MSNRINQSTKGGTIMTTILFAVKAISLLIAATLIIASGVGLALIALGVV